MTQIAITLISKPNQQQYQLELNPSTFICELLDSFRKQKQLDLFFKGKMIILQPQEQLGYLGTQLLMFLNEYLQESVSFDLYIYGENAKKHDQSKKIKLKVSRQINEVEQVFSMEAGEGTTFWGVDQVYQGIIKFTFKSSFLHILLRRIGKII